MTKGGCFMKKILKLPFLALVTLLTVFSLSSCFVGYKDKTFETEYYSITLPESFYELSRDNNKMHYRNDRVEIYAHYGVDPKGYFFDSRDNMEEYVIAIQEKLGCYPTESVDRGGYTSFKYYSTNPYGEEVVNFVSCLEQNEQERWFFKFTCLTRYESLVEPRVDTWTRSIVFV